MLPLINDTNHAASKAFRHRLTQPYPIHDIAYAGTERRSLGNAPVRKPYIGNPIKSTIFSCT
ncbi:hypothetical protein Metal_0088 [Methylomicrobium album BG8]|uniref:Uncharacterized protein n=1 Tax=Methylomicrobium album BG8 TaxID=686340 RepID=H8GJZ8_METAL|nr:hypothetical protein Metal_0088 [Methylomicrobium album BG8]